MMPSESSHVSRVVMECQNPELLESTVHYPLILTRLRLLGWYLKRDGLVWAIQKGAAVAFASMLRPCEPAVRRAPVGDEVLDLQVGEWVVVKSREEILATLDADGKHRGLRFVPEMFDYCGQRHQVFKRVQKICVENTPEVRRINHTVLLEGGLCAGGGIACDRACFHFWREAWLRRV